MARRPPARSRPGRKSPWKLVWLILPIVFSGVIWEVTRYRPPLTSLLPEDCLGFLWVKDYAARVDDFRGSAAFQALRGSDWFINVLNDPATHDVMMLWENPPESKIYPQYQLMKRLLGKAFVLGMTPGENGTARFALATRLGAWDRIQSLAGSILPPGWLVPEMERAKVRGWTMNKLSSGPAAVWMAVHGGVLVASDDADTLARMLGNFGKVSANRITRTTLFQELRVPDQFDSFMTICVFRFDELMARAGLSELSDTLKIQGMITFVDFDSEFRFRTRIRHSLEMPPHMDGSGGRSPLSEPLLLKDAYCYAEASLWFWYTWSWQSVDHNVVDALRLTLKGLGERYGFNLVSAGLPLRFLGEARPKNPQSIPAFLSMSVHTIAGMRGDYSLDKTEDPFQPHECFPGREVRESTSRSVPFAYAMKDGRLLTSQTPGLLCDALDEARPASASGWRLAGLLKRRPASCDFFAACDWEGYQKDADLAALRIISLYPALQPLVATARTLNYAKGWTFSASVEPKLIDLETTLLFQDAP